MVNFDNHIRRGHPVLFGLIVFFSIIEGAIATWLIARFDQHHNYPSKAVRDRTGLLTFTSWWTVLFGAIYAGLFLWSASRTSTNVLTSVGSHAIFLVITWILWTAGAASITAALGGGHNCSKTALVYCDQLNALEAFAWIVWVLVTIALFVVLVRGCLSARRGDGLKGQLVA
ncbi:uncharacterized protein FOMMEDRAFT_105969 [Fomitiporia mediterranea MF3/22]|uniref:uncharacterized protein n=1 Tax=Fomitiporia mediterranea (strain MF3/22) TaxID=694068 RepID=UPI00044084BF|nr:uncharacterized protein FOMMEDRAFT_105969 [Fomitiporia mediterranea MF3/22]EJD03794.1 hypothetical protein FOMMEDRAFT_105969 [Fomitiporia mediterranea MF3/22]